MVILACLLAGPAALPAPAALASTGPCVPGTTAPLCHFWHARVTEVNDGDTIDVRLPGSRRVRIVRFTAVQAMEQTRYSRIASRRRGQCHALAATNRVESLIRRSHGRVRLAAMNPGARAGGRLKRFIAVRVKGRWRDLGEILMREGRTLWMPSSTEWAWNGVYDLLGQRAAARLVGLFNPTTCGAGPAQDVPLKVWASSNPPGPDTQNLEGEWIKVQNLSYTTPVSLDRWWVRDSMLERFTFPRGTTLAPRATITVHTGPGTDTPGDLHWGLSQPIFGNANADDRRNLGDGAYLFDPQGDLRAWMLYPCLVDCTDPSQGALALTAQPRRGDSVTVTNISTHPVDLYGYQLLMDRDRAYWFAPGTVLDPGQSLPVAYASMRRRGDSVRLSTFNAITVACTAWGDGRC